MKKKNSKAKKWLMIGIAVLLAVTVVGVGAALLSNVERPDNSTPTPTPSGDEVTPCIHMYPDAPDFVASTAYTHSVVRTCSECGEKDIQQKDHVWKHGVCQHCKDECWHQTADRSKATYSNARYQVHDKTELCDECGQYVTPTAEAHTFVNGICALCDFECSHHDGDEVSATPASGGCILNGTCANCKQTFSGETVPHSYGVDLKCKRCATVCPHDASEFEYSYTEAEGKGYTWEKCPTCENVVVSDAVEVTITVRWALEELDDSVNFTLKVSKGMTWKDAMNAAANKGKLVAATATIDGFEYNTVRHRGSWYPNYPNGKEDCDKACYIYTGDIIGDIQNNNPVSINDVIDLTVGTYWWW